jgi:uncharacterized protein YqeY
VSVGAGAAAAVWSKLLSTFSCLPGARVRWRAALTLCSSADRREEYIERFSTDLWRITKTTATTPMMATAGPIRRSIGADYRRSVNWMRQQARGATGISGPTSYVTIRAVALYDRIQSELIEARRNRDELKLSTLSLLKSELVKASKETGAGALDDDLVIRVARKEVKRREEAIDLYRKAGRVESAAREEAEMAVLRSYLPAAMSTGDVESEVQAVIDELKPDGPKAFGAVMKAATARLAGRAEGAQVAAAARKLLGS